MSDALKRAVRARMKVTGERYTQARRALLAQRDAASPAAPTGEGERRGETHRPDLGGGAPNGR